MSTASAPGEGGRHGGRQHHGVHAGAMAGLFRLHQPEPPAMEGIDRMGWRVLDKGSARRGHYVWRISLAMPASVRMRRAASA
jgi:hypothetical protein